MNRRILIIDDNPSVQQEFRKTLGVVSSDTLSANASDGSHSGTGPPGAAKFSVDSAFQGEEGLELITTARAMGRPYSVAFIDIRMPPGWDGFETIERVWTVDPDIQTVLCLAYSDSAAHNVLTRLGVSDRLLLLKKPCDAAEVLFLTIVLSEKWKLARLPSATSENCPQRATQT